MTDLADFNPFDSFEDCLKGKIDCARRDALRAEFFLKEKMEAAGSLHSGSDSWHAELKKMAFNVSKLRSNVETLIKNADTAKKVLAKKRHVVSLFLEASQPNNSTGLPSQSKAKGAPKPPPGPPPMHLMAKQVARPPPGPPPPHLILRQ